MWHEICIVTFGDPVRGGEMAGNRSMKLLIIEPNIEM